MFSTGLSSGAREGRKTRVNVLRHDQATGRMPAGPIEEEHGVGAAPDTASGASMARSATTRRVASMTDPQAQLHCRLGARSFRFRAT
jgi:hypothetical protein